MTEPPENEHSDSSATVSAYARTLARSISSHESAHSSDGRATSSMAERQEDRQQASDSGGAITGAHQVACNSCRDSKQRCDAQRPSCARCRARGRLCTYETQTNGDSQPAALQTEFQALRMELDNLRGQQGRSPRLRQEAASDSDSLASSSVRRRQNSTQQRVEEPAVEDNRRNSRTGDGRPDERPGRRTGPALALADLLDAEMQRISGPGQAAGALTQEEESIPMNEVQFMSLLIEADLQTSALMLSAIRLGVPWQRVAILTLSCQSEEPGESNGLLPDSGD